VSFNDVNVPAAGTYRIMVRVKNASDTAAFRLSVDGVDQGEIQDTYRIPGLYEELDVGEKTFASSGNKTFKFTVTGKPAGAANYKLILDRILLMKVDQQLSEAESLTAAVSTGDSFAVVSDVSASGGQVRKLDGNAMNDYGALTVNVPGAGLYRIVSRMKKGPARAIAKLQIDGVSIDMPQDYYSQTDQYAESDHGIEYISISGNRSFKYVITGKNGAASDYTVVIDYVKLLKYNLLP